jgi:tRNA (uracil-5-)-methyltransferase TRM9
VQNSLGSSCIFATLIFVRVHYNIRVEKHILEKILDLNRQFYQTFSLQFSETRQRVQPGVRRIILEKLAGISARVLDLGCGNGELVKVLDTINFQGSYLGVDFSPDLLEEANRNAPGSFKAEFHQLDLSKKDWNTGPAGEALDRMSPFTYCLAFAVLHHIPGKELRKSVVQNASKYLEPGGLFIHSVWQFLNSPRLTARVQPWEKASIEPGQVEEGDFLLDWRHGGEGLRYAHHFTLEELEELATSVGFSVLETFRSDGEGGRLGLYQVWKKEQ